MIKVLNSVKCTCPICFHTQEVSEENTEKVIHCNQCYYNYFHEPEQLIKASCPKCIQSVKVAIKDINKVIHCDRCFCNYRIEKNKWKGVVK